MKHPLSVDQALEAREQGRHAVAIRALVHWAERGDGTAFHMLGFMYDTGQGTRRNRKKALYWYLRAYRSGWAIAASNIATMYRDSLQPRLEFAWYKRAAALGDGDALVDVGIRYLSGKGVRRSVPKAVTCFRAALRSGLICEASRDAARQLLWGCGTRARGGVANGRRA